MLNPLEFGLMASSALFRRNFAFRKGFAFRRTFTTGGLWPYYGYDYFPTDAYGDINGTAYPETVGFVPEPPPAPVAIAAKRW
jgi:hypothetical protein